MRGGGVEGVVGRWCLSGWRGGWGGGRVAVTQVIAGGCSAGGGGDLIRPRVRSAPTRPPAAHVRRSLLRSSPVGPGAGPGAPAARPR